jgi:hypothetical protein
MTFSCSTWVFRIFLPDTTQSVASRKLPRSLHARQIRCPTKAKARLSVSSHGDSSTSSPAPWSPWGKNQVSNRSTRFAVNADSLCERYFEYWLDRDRPNWRNEFDEGRQREKDKAIEPSAKKTGRALRTLTLLSYIRDLELRDSVGDSLMSILSNEKSYFEKLVSSLYPLLEKLTTGKMAELISPSYFDLDDKRPIIDWMEVINRRAIVYIGLDSLTDYEVAGAVGNAMFADLTSIAGKLYKIRPGLRSAGFAAKLQGFAACRRIQRINR